MHRALQLPSLLARDSEYHWTDTPGVAVNGWHERCLEHAFSLSFSICSCPVWHPAFHCSIVLQDIP